VRYYRITVAPDVGQQWYPEEPVGPDGLSIDARTFVDCAPYDGPPLALRTRQRGRKFQINFGPFDMPVADVEFCKKLGELARNDLQIVAATIDGTEPACIVNVLTCCDCIDEARTVGTKWTAADRRPEKVGLYRMIVRLFVDPGCVGGSDVFRIRNWETPLIVSERVASSLTQREREGVHLIPVS
jgi:hypothetical protein